MKITSRFTDYYDHAVSPDMIDPAIRYIRVPSVEPYALDKQYPVLPWNKPLVHAYRKHEEIGRSTARLNLKMEVLGNLSLGNHERKEDFTLVEGLLLLAGKAYRVWLRNNIDYTHKTEFMDFQGYPDFPQMANASDLPSNAALPYGCPNLDDFRETITRFYTQHPKVTKVEQYKPSTTRWDFRSFMDDGDSWQRQYDQAMTEFCSQDFNGFMFKLQVPVALIVPPHTYKVSGSCFNNEQSLLIKNPPLRAFQFFKQMDQYTCWQEISMWIGGVMPGRQSPMVEIGDDSKIKKHGFDPVMGFRKRKQGTK